MTNTAAWTPQEGADRATALATETFGAPPVGVWCAPGRVNLIGEHVDYNGGTSAPIALPHCTYAAVTPRDDLTLRIVSEQTGEVVEVGLEDFPEGEGSWVSYVAGTLKALDKLGYLPLQGMDVAITSCVPLGAGLSSSAALECAVALAAADLGEPSEEFKALDEDGKRAALARACVIAENDYAGAATGGMDQAASLRAKQGRALAFNAKDGSVTHVPLDLEAWDYTLLVIDTRASHTLADGQYASRREASENAAALLGFDLLADATEADLERLEDPLLLRRARHVVTEVARTDDFLEELSAADPDRIGEIGRLMTASHASLRDDYEVSCEELDVAVDAALGAGAVGARMTGGGFGGSAIALVPNGVLAQVESAVLEAFNERGFRAPDLIEAVASKPARKVSAF